MAVDYKKIGLVNTKEMFARAIKGGWAVPAFNFNNLEQLQAIIQASSNLKSYHQHGTAVAYGFVIQVDAHDGVAAQGCGTVGHLSEGCILSLAEGAFVRTASAADYITDTGKEILYKVGTDDGFAGHYATVFTDRVAFYCWSGT